jgi:Na+/H+-translocating membrane pyrophosphatase
MQDNSSGMIGLDCGLRWLLVVQQISTRLVVSRFTACQSDMTRLVMTPTIAANAGVIVSTAVIMFFLLYVQHEITDGMCLKLLLSACWTLRGCCLCQSCYGTDSCPLNATNPGWASSLDMLQV